jgi:hypothetical protein
MAVTAIDLDSTERLQPDLDSRAGLEGRQCCVQPPLCWLI